MENKPSKYTGKIYLENILGKYTWEIYLEIYLEIYFLKNTWKIYLVYSWKIYLPPFTVGFVPRMLDQLGKPQKVIVFGQAESFQKFTSHPILHK